MWQIDERLQVAVIVYVEWGEGNLLGQVYKQPGKPWLAELRIRQYIDDKVFESDDKKYRFRLVAEPGEGPERLVDELVGAAKDVEEKLKASFHLLRVYGDGKKAMRMLAETTWAHMKAVDPNVTEAEIRSKLTNGKAGN